MASPPFAAFYPNSFSVFGFHDPDPGDDLNELQYEVVGWYSDKSKDILSKFILENPNLEDITTAIKGKFNWEVATSESDTPDRILCYAGLNFSKPSAEQNTEEDTTTSITFANTGTEALSACLADLLSKKETTDSKEQEHYLRLIEDQLEAVQLSFRLDEKKLDTVARFKELRHENSFTPVDSGHLWVIRNENVSTSRAKHKMSVPELPPEIGTLLNEVNELQRAYDAARHNIDQLRKQLFADWYKYMICVYPPDTIQDYPSPDLVKHFIETKVMAPLNEKISCTGELGAIKKDENDNITGIETTGGGEKKNFSLAQRLANKVNELISQIELAEDQINEALAAELTADEVVIAFNYFIEQIPGPRFWEPNAPVVLLKGDAVKTTNSRHGQDGILTCAVFSSSGDNLFENTNDFTKIADKVNAKLAADQQGLNTWTQQPWNPFLLEWQTQLFSAETKSNRHLNEGTYSNKFVASNYEAPILNPDLEFKRGKGKIVSTGRIYSGDSILSPQANELLEYSIEDQLVNKLAKFKKGKEISITNWKEEKKEDKSTHDNPVYNMIRAYEKLQELKGIVLSQSLNGFNEALLMHKQTMELSVEDPLGFDAYQNFSAKPEEEAATTEGEAATTEEYATTVEEAMGGDVKNAPSPLNSFNPIRTGCLKILRLRLVDTFGQTKDIDTDQVDTTYKMTSPKSKYLVKLPPRLAQPARLNFRWLDAVQDSRETNTHTASTPICGWLLTNTFDQSVMFYDAQGKALGYFKAEEWREAIDSDHAMSIDDIPNPHLKRVANYVEYSIGEDKQFIEHFIATINDAMANIQPEDSAYKGAALLIGKPVAVVRASLNLELSGKPAVNQDWNVFRSDMAKNKRSSDAFTRVQFPVRLGEYGQLNDGLVGYWLEKKEKDGTISFTTEQQDEEGNIVSAEGSKFYSPQSNYIDSATIESRYLSDGAINFYQSLDDAPQTVTLLMHAQGSIHATVGILPNKEITIPQEQYSEALKNIEVSFLHAPLLTRQGKINLPLRSVSDYAWSWVERKNSEKWTELFPENRIEQAVFIEKWNKAVNEQTLTENAGSELSGQQLWDYLLSSDIKWLEKTDDDEDGELDSGIARILNKDDRKSLAFSDPFTEKEDLAERVLDACSVGIDPVQTEAVFTGPQELKEGWLKLRKRIN